MIHLAALNRRANGRTPLSRRRTTALPPLFSTALSLLHADAGSRSGRRREPDQRLHLSPSGLWDATEAKSLPRRQSIADSGSFHCRKRSMRGGDGGSAISHPQLWLHAAENGFESGSPRLPSRIMGARRAISRASGGREGSHRFLSIETKVATNTGGLRWQKREIWRSRVGKTHSH